VVLLAAEFLEEAKPYIEDGVHPHNLIRSYRTAANMVCDHILSFEDQMFDSLKSELSDLYSMLFVSGNSKS
jgi:T-complex protein 1 subunit eta